MDSSPCIRKAQNDDGVDSSHSTNAQNDENKPLAKIFYHSTKDDGILRRKDKFALLNSLAQNGLDSVKWQGLSLSEPYFWFVPKSFENAEYEDFWALAGDKALGDGKAIFENFSSGVKTQKDEVAIQFAQKEIQAVLDDFVNLNENEIAQKYGVENVRDWQIDKAKAEVISTLKSPYESGVKCESGAKSPSPSLAEGVWGVGEKTQNPKNSANSNENSQNSVNFKANSQNDNFANAKSTRPQSHCAREGALSALFQSLTLNLRIFCKFMDCRAVFYKNRAQ